MANLKNLDDRQKYAIATLFRSMGYTPRAGSSDPTTKQVVDAVAPVAKANPYRAMAQKKEEPKYKEATSADFLSRDNIASPAMSAINNNKKELETIIKYIGAPEGSWKEEKIVDDHGENVTTRNTYQFTDDFRKSFDEKLKIRVYDLGKGVQQRVFVDAKTGKPVLAGQRWQTSSDSDFLKQGVAMMAPMVLGLAPFGTMLGSSLGLSGAAAKVAGSALLNTGIGALSGANSDQLLKGAVTGALSGGIEAFGAAQSWAPGVSKLASRTVPALLGGANPKALLMQAAIGQVAPTNNAGLNRLLQTIIRAKTSKGKRP